MISNQLKAVILKELNLLDFPIAESSVASDVPGWDSLSHVRIISRVEDSFGIRFKPLEVLKLKTVGDLQKIVDTKLAALSVDR